MNVFWQMLHELMDILTYAFLVEHLLEIFPKRASFGADIFALFLEITLIVDVAPTAAFEDDGASVEDLAAAAGNVSGSTPWFPVGFWSLLLSINFFIFIILIL